MRTELFFFLMGTELGLYQRFQVWMRNKLALHQQINGYLSQFVKEIMDFSPEMSDD